MSLLEVLCVEPDLVLRLSDLLEPRSLAALEGSCRTLVELCRCHHLWRRKFLARSRTRYMGTDWSRRLGEDGGSEDYKSLVARMEQVGRQWALGPLQEHHVELGAEPVADLALDETGLAVGLRRGEVRLYRRRGLQLQWAVVPSTARLSRVALSSAAVLCVPLQSEACMHVVCRDSGALLHTLALRHPVSSVLCGEQGLLVAHPAARVTLHPEDRSRVSCYSLPSPSYPPVLLYSLEEVVDRLSLGPCRRRFLAGSDLVPGHLSLHCLATGVVLATLRPAPPTVAPESGWQTHGLGWLSPTHVWLVWRNTQDTNLPYSVAVLDLAGRGKATFEKVQWDGGATNWRELLLLARHRHLMAVTEEGRRREEDATLSSKLRVNLRTVEKVCADATGLVYTGTWVLPHLATQRGNVVLLREFI